AARERVELPAVLGPDRPDTPVRGRRQGGEAGAEEQCDAATDQFPVLADAAGLELDRRRSRRSAPDLRSGRPRGYSGPGQPQVYRLAGRRRLEYRGQFRGLRRAEVVSVVRAAVPHPNRTAVNFKGNQPVGVEEGEPGQRLVVVGPLDPTGGGGVESDV